MIVQCTSIIVTSEENVEISDFLSWPSRQTPNPFIYWFIKIAMLQFSEAKPKACNYQKYSFSL